MQFVRRRPARRPPGRSSAPFAKRLRVAHLAAIICPCPSRSAPMCSSIVTCCAGGRSDWSATRRRSTGRFATSSNARKRAGVKVGAIFGPQHGFRSDLQENMIESPHVEDARRRVRVYSLYSETREPTAGDARWTRRAGDRPAGRRHAHLHLHLHDGQLPGRGRAGTMCPSSSATGPIRSAASTVEGPMLEPGFESFVGLYPIPMRHGMTIGELAQLFNEPLRHRRQARSRARCRDGRATSSSMRPACRGCCRRRTSRRSTARSSIRARCCFEGTNVSEGRGTTKPFELVGAPWVDPEPFAAGLNARGLPGVQFRPALFEPTFHKHAQTPCGGCQIHVTDRQSFRPVEAGVALIDAFHTAGPDRFMWREPPYEYESRQVRRSTSCTGRVDCARRSPTAQRQRSLAPGPRTSPRS